MLKIEALTTPGGRPRLRLEGRIIGPWVAELRRTCEHALIDGAGLGLDLSEVSFVDPPGLDLLAALERRGVTLDCSRFVAEQLKARRQR
jgi:hypothetical protein